MSGDTGTGPDTNTGPGGSSDATGSLGKKILGVCTVLTALVGLAGQVSGFWKDTFGTGDAHPAPVTVSRSAESSPSLSPASTATQAATAGTCGAPGHHGVSLKFDGRPTRYAAHVIATVTCRLPPGDHLSWVVSKRTGDPDAPQTHFTLRMDLGQVPGTYGYPADLSTTPAGSKRELFVVLLDDATYREVKASTDSDNYVRMPSPVPTVSDVLLIVTPA
jgi:hypothetical protein